MTDTGDILAAAHARADAVSATDQAELGRALLYCGASILGQAAGPRELCHTMVSLSISAEAAIAEGERNG